MLWTYVPNASWNTRTVLGGMGAPPDQILVSDASASRSAFGAFISAMNTVIDPTVNVGRCSRIVSTARDGSNRWKSTSGAPSSRLVVTPATRPVMWNRGATPSTTSSGPSPHHCRYVWLLKTTLPWVFIAPLGGPVVPEV